MDYELTYADTIEEGTQLAERIRSVADRSGALDLGFDTEFYGVRVGKESTVARAKVHFASLAWLEGGERFHPRGYTIPRAAVVSRKVVVECEPFRRLFMDKRLVWFAHNAPVDVHTMKNEGVDILNVVNTLTLARWTYPARARAQYGGGGFSLDALGQDLLGVGKLETFSELFRELRETWKETVLAYKSCACGTAKCRKRSAGHTKQSWTETVREPVVVEADVPLEEVTPGHPLFERAKRYSAQDAVLAHCLKQVLYRQLETQERVVPWLPKSKFSLSPAS